MSTDAIMNALRDAELIVRDETPALEALTGGVSSDIWKVETARGPVCVKRALSKLKTKKTWHAPVERNASEAEWIRTVAAIAPDAVPRILAEDRNAGLFVMEYFEPAEYPVWKQQLRDGHTQPDTAAAIGATLGAIHAATAGRDDLRRSFATDHIFHPIRIEPYLLRTADAHPDLKERLHRLADITGTTRKTLVHGDVSPKNILIGPNGPVFLDAECAWYGDPAFDLAFCLNHLLLKCIWVPAAAKGYLESYAACAARYLQHVDWEPAEELEQRTAALLPGLMLARIDGASPVEYITDDIDRNRVRRAASAALRNPSETLADICRRFREDAKL
jgi:aminoglycoside phosphotransferase (APT) family kinase protein